MSFGGLHSSSRSSWLSSTACRRPHAQSALITGSRLNPSFVAAYSTRGGTSLKTSRWHDPVFFHLAQAPGSPLLADVRHHPLQLGQPPSRDHLGARSAAWALRRQ